LVTVLTSPEASVFDKARACQRLAIIGDESSVAALADLLTDEKLSAYARDALEAIPGAAPDVALRDAVAQLEGDRLIDVLSSIGVRRDAEAIGAIAALLGSDDKAIAAAAARSLGHIGTPQAADELQSMLSEAKAESGVTLGNACLICIQQLAKQGKVEKAVALCDAIETADLPDYIQSKATFNAILAQGEDGLPKLAELLKSDDETSFQLALQAIRLLEIDASSELHTLFKNVSPARQVLLLKSLEELGNKAALPTVVKASQAGEPKVRIQAIRTLAKVGDATVVPFLVDVAAKSDEQLADAARSTLAVLPFDEIDTAVLDLLTSDDAATQRMAIDMAARRRIAEASPALLHLAESDDVTTREVAINALAATVRMEHLSDFISVATKAQSSFGYVAMRSALAAACVRMPQEGCAEKLAAALSGAPPTARRLLLEQLASVGGATALETVVAAARSNDDAMQDNATRLLGEWLTADAAPALFDLAKTLPEGKYQIRALRGYIRIARQLDVTPEARMTICRNVLAIAKRSDDKVLVLEVLKRYPTREGLQLAEPLLEDPELRAAAQSTIRIIRGTIAG
jgi:HEAT repeat protein